MRNAAIIVAAGQGLRLGGPVPKQFQALGAEPVLTRTLRAVLAAPVDAVVVAIHPDARALYDAAAAPVAEPEPNTVTVDFWQFGSSAYTISRAIGAPAWTDVVDHYPAPVRAAVDDLLVRELTLHGGRIILWYGPPGTGKTTAIRALARSW